LLGGDVLRCNHLPVLVLAMGAQREADGNVLSERDQPGSVRCLGFFVIFFLHSPSLPLFLRPLPPSLPFSFRLLSPLPPLPLIPLSSIPPTSFFFPPAFHSAFISHCSLPSSPPPTTPLTPPLSSPRPSFPTLSSPPSLSSPSSLCPPHIFCLFFLSPPIYNSSPHLPV